MKRHTNGLNSVLKYVVDMFKEVEIEGVDVVVNKEVISLDAHICICAADNLGCHQLTGMAESFNSRFSCCDCYITRQEMAKATRLDDVERRTHHNFYAHLDAFEEDEEDSVPSQNILTQTRGIYHRSELGRLRNFKIPEMMAPDVFHDLDEGFGVDLFNYTLDELINTGVISRADAESRIYNFNYGELDAHHKPFNVRRMSGVQRRNVLLRFNFIFADIAPPELLEATGLFSRQIQICYSDTVYETTLEELQSIQGQMLDIWHYTYKKHIKPKPHFFLHFVEKIRALGPLAASETTAFEMHHRNITRIPKQAPQFINILKSCAVKHQYAWAHAWKNQEFHSFSSTKPKLISLDTQDVVSCHANTKDWTVQVHEVKLAKYIFTYRKGLFVTERAENGFSFFKIQNVIVEKEKIFLKCYIVRTVYESFFAAHKILFVENNCKIIDVHQLKIKDTFAEISPYNSQDKYILCKRNVHPLT